MKKYFATALALSFMVPATAYSMSNFPEQIQRHLGLTAPPDCTLCHGSSSGGGAVSQPFGRAMIAAGLTVVGGNTLTNALDQLEADNTDANGDGTPDILGLKQGIQPAPAKPPIEYGCGGGHVAPAAPSGWKSSGLAASAMLLMFLHAARRRRDFIHPMGIKVPSSRILSHCHRPT